jgi:hypothetical protein
MDQTQLDRIERKLDEVLAFRDLVLKLALPRIPAGMRERVAAVVAGRGAGS